MNRSALHPSLLQRECILCKTGQCFCLPRASPNRASERKRGCRRRRWLLWPAVYLLKSIWRDLTAIITERSVLMKPFSSSCRSTVASPLFRAPPSLYRRVCPAYESISSPSCHTSSDKKAAALRANGPDRRRTLHLLINSEVIVHARALCRPRQCAVCSAETFLFIHLSVGEERQQLILINGLTEGQVEMPPVTLSVWNCWVYVEVKSSGTPTAPVL